MHVCIYMKYIIHVYAYVYVCIYMYIYFLWLGLTLISTMRWDLPPISRASDL